MTTQTYLPVWSCSLAENLKECLYLCTVFAIFSVVHSWTEHLLCYHISGRSMCYPFKKTSNLVDFDTHLPKKRN